jgi:integrase
MEHKNCYNIYKIQIVTLKMGCKMNLNDSFWKLFELDINEIRLSFLSYCIGYAREPKPKYRHLFLWDHQNCFCPINSRYGRAFSFSPFGPGVRGVPKHKGKGMPKGLDEIDMALKARLTENTRHIRTAIANALETGNMDNACQMVLNFFWLKLGAHELLFDRTQLKYDKHKKVRKGRWGLDESEGSHTLTGLRNRIVNAVRFGKTLENEYIQNLNKKLLGFSQGTLSTFLSSALRVSEINRLTWDDVDLQNRSATLYTRKKKGGHLTPRRIPMTQQLFDVLKRRYENRNPSKPWVFWHRYWSRKQGRFVEGPYGDRKKVMKRLCKKAGVRYFRFHPIRHSGASIMDGNGVPLGAIQRILGHENRKTTEIYLHSMGDSERDAMRVFE